jgi:hypothetical protein
LGGGISPPVVTCRHIDPDRADARHSQTLETFYDRFGDQIVGELVDWFNAVDATYSANLRDLNEVNFARFDAKLNQRFAEQDPLSALRSLESRVLRVNDR